MVKMRKKIGGQFVVEPVHVRFWRAVEKTDGCWLWMGCRHYKGYGEFTIGKIRGKLSKTKAHRMAWTLSNGEIPAGMLVCHRCDNPQCVNPNHLFLGTAKTNKLDCIFKGRHAFGEKAGRAKLTESKVKEVRKLDQEGMTRVKIGALFGISGRNVTSICRREIWRHVS